MAALPPDLRQPGDFRPVISGTFLLATGGAPLLDGVTQGGQAAAYHDGTDQFVVPTFPDIGPRRIAQERFTTGAVVSGNAVVALYSYKDAAARLAAWAPGDGMATELDSRACPARPMVAASPSGRHVAYVRVADLSGELGHIQIRRRDGSGVAVSPIVVRDIDLLRCATELRFWDETHLVAFYCQKVDGVPRVVVVDAESGAVVSLSDPSKERVEQVVGVPGGRVLWTNLLSSTLDPGALKAGTIAGDVRQVLARGVPRRQVAQLVVSPGGEAAYYLSGTGALLGVSTERGGEVLLSAERVDRIAGVSPDGKIVAVTRARVMPPDRLSLIDVVTKESVDVPVGMGLVLQSALFTADSSHVLYVTDSDVLSAYPVRGGMGAQRVVVKARASRWLPLLGTQLLVFHDATNGGQEAVLSLLDVRDPQRVLEKTRGVNPSPAGFWQLVPDGTKLLFVKGSGVYVMTLP